MSLRILVVCDAFGPPAYLPRIRFFCDYLTQQGHSIDVYTEKYCDLPFEHHYSIFAIPFYKNGVDRLVKRCWNVLSLWKDRFFYNRIMEMVGERSYDVVFCSTFANFPLYAAYQVANAKKLPLVLDIRDVVEQVDPGQSYFTKRTHVCFIDRWVDRLNVSRRDAVLRKASALITISGWHQQFLQKINPNTHLIYNGYDPGQFYFEGIKSDYFYITYIGRLYSFQKNDLLRKSLQELGLEKVRVRFYTPETDLLPIDGVGDVIRESSIMLVYTHSRARGVLTTKFYEAFGCEKPVLCLPSDNGDLASLVHYTNAGVISSDVEEIKSFIVDKYAEWQKQGYTHQMVKHKEEFSRIGESRQIEVLLSQYA